MTTKLRELITPKMKVSTGFYCLVLDKMPASIVQPKDLLQPLSEAISSYTAQQTKIKLTDIKLYDLHHKDGSFVGNLYATEQDDVLIGSIVGDDDICLFEKDSIEYKETDKVFVPLLVKENQAWVLICEYKCSTSSLTAKCLKKIDAPLMQNEEILQEFEAETSFEKAYNIFKEKIC